jgi:mono/diheme cytochrome c family protein
MKEMKYQYLLAISAFVLILITSCSKNSSGGASLYTPSSADATSTATLADLQQGRTLYMNNCNACHGLYSPDDYNSTQWKSILTNMGPRTSMTSAQILLVTKYVTRGQ